MTAERAQEISCARFAYACQCTIGGAPAWHGACRSQGRLRCQRTDLEGADVTFDFETAWPVRGRQIATAWEPLG